MATARQRTPARPQRPVASEHFPAMLQLAKQLGCQLRPTPSNPAVLRGLCPFHQADSLNDANTLQINTRTTRFSCQVCNAHGNPIAFTARVWGVSATDAHHLIAEGGTLDRTRPPYPKDFFHQQKRSANSPQNTAILTRAARHYGQQLYTSHAALQFIAQLGIDPDDAVKAGIGYCPGMGLRQYLLNHGVTPEEMEDSPLFHPETGIETFTGNITLADRDFTGSTLWMTSTVPEAPPNSYAWRNRRPHTHGIPGGRPVLLNIYCINRQTPSPVITDDARLYITLVASNFPVVLIAQRRRPEQDTSRQCEMMAGALRNRGVTHPVLAIHDMVYREEMGRTLEHVLRQPAIQPRTREKLMEQLDPRTRNLKEFTNPASLSKPPPTIRYQQHGRKHRRKHRRKRRRKRPGRARRRNNRPPRQPAASEQPPGD